MIIKIIYSNVHQYKNKWRASSQFQLFSFLAHFPLVVMTCAFTALRMTQCLWVLSVDTFQMTTRCFRDGLKTTCQFVRNVTRN